MRKPEAGEMKIQAAVFVWIVLVNLAVQIWSAPLAGIGFCSWAFFLNSVLYFLSGEEDPKKRFLEVLLGSACGILLAAGLVLAAVELQETGLGQVAATMVPLVLCLALMILLHPYCPLVLNNAGFGYFIVALIHAESAAENVLPYLGSHVAGQVIVVGGALLAVRACTARRCGSRE